MSEDLTGKNNKVLFAPTTLAEQEIVLRLDREEGLAHVCSCWPEMTKRIIKRHGPPKETTTDGRGRVTSAIWVLPLDFIVSGILRKRRVMTEAQREAARTRLKNARFARESPT